VTLVAGIAAGVAALPQLATMLGVPLPPWSILVSGAAAAGVIAIGARWFRFHQQAGQRSFVRGGLLAAVAIAAAVAIGAVVIGAPATLLTLVLGIAAWPVLLFVAVATVPFGRVQRDYLVLWVVAGTGLVAGLIAAALPTGSAVLDNLTYELPKTTNYFSWPFVAVAASVGVAGLGAMSVWPRAFRAAVAGIFLIALATPIRPAPIEPLTLAEHRLSETSATFLETAADGYWQGSPDSRWLIDSDEREILDAVRAEIAAGRLGPDDGVLHVAASFQPWSSVPLAIFDGVVETSATLDAEVSIHTAGGRLHQLSELPQLVDGGFRYLVVEPAGLPADLDWSVINDRFEPVFSNARGTLLVGR
jgi:hypothetical protein